MAPSLKEIAEFSAKKWYETSGLVIAIVVCTVVAEGLLVAGSAAWWLNLTAITVLNALVGLIWWLSTRPPKTPQGKIGFLVSVTSADDAESQRLKEDFLVPLQRLIKSGNTGKAFHFMRLPNHLAEKIIDEDDAQRARMRSRAHFILYGHVKRRTIGGKEHHVIELDGIVTHREVPDEVSKALANEFSELWPRRVNIPTEDDLLAFRFTSEWAELVAKYIIGIAAALSGDLAYAEKLYLDAQERLNTKDKSFPVYQKLSVRLPSRISEIYETHARIELSAWAEDHDASHIEAMSDHLAKATGPSTQSLITTKAISAFMSRRAADEAIALLKKIQNQNDPLWHYNMGFLYGYKGNLKVASRHYNQASLWPIKPISLAQIEDFMCWALDEEPGKFQLHFCLGLFNWKAKGDTARARLDFEKFLAEGKPSDFAKERQLAAEWIGELQAESHDNAG
jgi:tetratricopeptide (TPR) repeat protein